MALLWIVLGAALVIATAIFHSLNPMAVDLNLFGYPIFGAPLWALVAVPAVAGLAIGILMDVPDRVRSALQGRRLTKQLRERDKTITQLQQRVAELEGKLAAPPVVIE
ncbi:MAG TPA: LapA family protein, partial [Chloroflexota bacterium]|nr:LapA family protein [Chloroflexota bacterium]